MIVSNDIGTGTTTQVLGSNGFQTIWTVPMGAGSGSIFATSTGFVVALNGSDTNNFTITPDTSACVSGSITLPSMIDSITGEAIVRIFSNADVTTLSLDVPSDGSGVAFNPGVVVPTTLTPGDSFSFYYSSSTNTWFLM